jgi:hypothetical protein
VKAEAADRRVAIVADQLGLPSFPLHLWTPDHDMGAHVTGFAATAWLVRYPVERWGDEWLRRGTMHVRYRKGLHVGDPLTIEIRSSDDALAVDVRAANGDAVMTAGAALAIDPPPPAEHVSPEWSVPLAPYADALDGHDLGRLETDFVAERDLAFVTALAPDDPWRTLRIAHPTYLVSVANLLVKNAVAFTGGRWTHAGSEWTNRRPIEDGARLTFTGHISEVRHRATIDLAVAAITVAADGEPATELRLTFVCERPPVPPS